MKQITVLFFLLFTIVSFSQDSIQLTPKGIVSTTTEESFVVIKFDEIPTETLYTNSLLFISNKYDKPNEQIKFSIENKNIKYTEDINTRRITNNPSLKAGFKRNLHIDFSLSFKENTVKFEIIKFNLGAIVLSEKMRSKYPIWDYDNGQLLLNEEKANLENVINEILSDYILFMEKKNNEKW